MISIPGTPIRILIISEDVFVRRSLAHDIEQCDQFVTCGTAECHEAALDQLVALQPDIAILDLSVRNGLGLRLIQQFKERHPQMRLVVTSMQEDAFYVGQILAAGAHMYFSKRGEAKGFVDGLKRVARGELYVSSDIAQQLLQRSTGKQSGSDTSAFCELTGRELQVFEFLGQGYNTKKIASQLGISKHTVETYRERIRIKIDAKDGADLTFRAISWALLS